MAKNIKLVKQAIAKHRAGRLKLAGSGCDKSSWFVRVNGERMVLKVAYSGRQLDEEIRAQQTYLRNNPAILKYVAWWHDGEWQTWALQPACKDGVSDKHYREHLRPYTEGNKWRIGDTAGQYNTGYHKGRPVIYDFGCSTYTGKGYKCKAKQSSNV